MKVLAAIAFGAAALAPLIDARPPNNIHAARIYVTPSTCETIDYARVPPTVDALVTSRVSTVSFEGVPESEDTIFSVSGADTRAVSEVIAHECKEKTWARKSRWIEAMLSNAGDPADAISDRAGDFFRSTVPAKASGDDIRKIVDNGDPKNRIDVVFLSDGYTMDEKEKFFSDIEWLTNDMWSSDTFASYLPVFNVWALFRPSKTSGIGNGKALPGASFGLYRVKEELREIQPTNQLAAMSACKSVGADACDYPSIIGNDEFYGGLGGLFVIATSSRTSGSIVLRHEMGHNFVKVGEEYDGGYTYSGANSAKDLKSLKWTHWLTDPKNVREERSDMLMLEFPWYNLDKGPWVKEFTSTGNFARWTMTISAAGVEKPNSLEVYLDGKKLNWTTSGITDRGFYDWYGNEGGFTAGTHKIEVKQGFPAPKGRVPVRQLCKIVIHEYGTEQEYVYKNNSYISAYPTFSINNKKSLRPTNKGCLMGEMRAREFCSPCKESMWLEFFKKISLIDNVNVECQTSNGDSSATNNNKKVSISINVVPLGQFRENKKLRLNGENIKITWFKDSKALAQFDGQTRLALPASEANGKWKVEAEYNTPEIRVKRVLFDKKFDVKC